MALHLVFPALRSVAPLLDDMFFIFLPASSQTKLYLGCVSFIRKRPPVFPTLYSRVGWIVVNRLLFYLYESMLRLLFY